jgi:hypothetical protein
VDLEPSPNSSHFFAPGGTNCNEFGGGASAFGQGGGEGGFDEAGGDAGHVVG